MLRSILAINIALLRRADATSGPCYKHGPPNGGRMLRPILAINMAILTEGDCYVRFLL